MKTAEEMRAGNRERQKRYREKHGWVAKSRQRESMRMLRLRRKPVITPPVNNKPVLRDNALPHYGEIKYEPEEGYDIDMGAGGVGSDQDGGRGYGNKVEADGGEDREDRGGDREPGQLHTRDSGRRDSEVELKAAEDLVRLVARRKERGVVVDLEL